MATNVIMPALGSAQVTGKLLQWLKAEGEKTTIGEVLMVVETDKTTVEIEAPATGILSQITANVGDEVPVGQVIALILGEGESAPAKTPSLTQPAAQTSVATSATITASPLARRIADENGVDLSKVKLSGERIEKADVLAYIEEQKTVTPVAQKPEERLMPASPKARVAATEHRLNITQIPGSGPSGAVLYADVQKAAQTQPTSKVVAATVTPTDDIIKPGTVWRIMADRLTQSWTTVPHFYLSREVNASRLITWRERAQKRFTEKITFTDLLVRLVAAALVEHPRLNAMWKDGAIHLNNAVNIGLAVAIEDGLVVPVIHDAQKLSIAEIARQRIDIVTRAQSGKLRPNDISNGTFTISNLGMYGIDTFNAIVNPPQAAILAIGRISQRVVAIDDRPAVQSMMTVSLSCDHRAVDGARGAQFLQTLADMVEEPLGLLD